MALVHVTGARNAMADACVDLIDVGATDAAGDLMIMTGADAEVSIHLCISTAFGAASGGTATADAIADDTSAAGGTAALFKFQDRENAEVFRGTVTNVSGGGDIELDNVIVGVGVTVQITSFTYSASA